VKGGVELRIGGDGKLAGGILGTAPQLESGFPAWRCESLFPRIALG
jgi:hypothetical protein